MVVSFIHAIAFLTVFPVPDRFYEKHPLPNIQTTLFFPFIGLLIGAIFSLCAFAIHAHVPPYPLSILAIFALAAVSGFLHLDGLADSADGFFSSRPKDRILEIMKDSRIGSMGAVILFFTLMMKVSALAVLYPSRTDFCIALFLMPFAGRCFLVIGMYLQPYAREEGLGKCMWNDKPLVSFIAIVLFSVVILFFFKIKMAFLILMIFLFFCYAYSKYCKKKIGGATGDTLGAGCELSETLIVFILCLV